MNDPENSYNLTYLSLSEFESRMSTMADPMVLPKVLDAYEVSRSVHEHQKRNDGTPYFYHSTRVVRILLDEVGIKDTDIIVGSLLHDVLEDSDVITKGILEYNFGAYVAFLVETLTKDLNRAKADPELVDIQHCERLKNAPVDCMLIKMASRLDNMRCLEFYLKKNPLVYISNTFDRYLPIAENMTDERLHYLVKEIRAEANKFLG